MADVRFFRTGASGRGLARQRTPGRTYVGRSSLELVALELVVGGRTARESRGGQGEQSNEKPVASFENDTGLSDL